MTPTSKAQALVSRDEVLALIAAKKKVFGGATTDICLNGLTRDIAALPNAKADDVRGEVTTDDIVPHALHEAARMYPEAQKAIAFLWGAIGPDELPAGSPPRSAR